MKEHLSTDQHPDKSIEDIGEHPDPWGPLNPENLAKRRVPPNLDDQMRDYLPINQKVSELAVAEGERIARRFFAKRGNHSEAHVGEAELAALLALTFDRAERHVYRSIEQLRSERDEARACVDRMNLGEA